MLFNEGCHSGRFELLTPFVHSNLVNFDTSFNVIMKISNLRDRFSMIIQNILIQIIEKANFQLLDV